MTETSDTPRRLGVGYVRVSTQRQAEEGVSLEAQFDKIRGFAAFKDLDIVGLYGDPGISGKNLEDRPGIQAVLELARAGKITDVIVYKLTRVGRKILDTLGAVYELDRLGVTVHSVMEQFDTKSPVGKLILAVLAATGEFERDTLIENTLAGMQKKRDNGGRISRFAPLGSQLDGDNVIPDPREQHAMALAQTWKKDTSMSYQDIADVLAEMGYKSPRSGKPYSKSSITKMVKGVER